MFGIFKKKKITKKYKNGDTYVGEMKNDKPHGYGTYTWPIGEKYVGVFKNDKKHGQGTWTFKDIKYVGEWKEDSMHGQGTLTSNGKKFIGKFKDNYMVKGTTTWTSGESAGDKYVGDHKDHDQHGQGTHTWSNGDKYIGEWKKGNMHGHGNYIWTNGDKYIGEVKNDEMHGQGTHTWANGDEYVGTWKDGEQCEGTFTSADGKVEQIKKTIKRNELSIFEELRLKKPTDLREAPKKTELKKIDNIYYYYNEIFKKNTYWQKNPSGRIVQVNEYGELIYSGNDEYQKNIPDKSSLKKYKTNIMFHVELFEEAEISREVTWWVEDKNRELIQLNVKEEEVGIEFKIKSWIRNKAIDVVSLEIRSMKKNAYEYSKDELMRMIKKEENKLIKKGGWKALRMAALSSLGLSWLPFI
jgi:hypothetical protein